MSMELPSPKVIRERIESVSWTSMRRYLQALYLFAARASELCGEVANKDKVKQVYGPHGADVRSEFWRDETYPDIKAEVAVFELHTAKRDGFLRNVGLPFGYDPWVKELYEYWQQAGERHVFPFDRHAAKYYVNRQKVFAGLQYPIAKYKTFEEKLVMPTDTERVRVARDVNEHMKPLVLHGLRHIRATELMEKYNFNLEQVAVFGGWKVRSVQSISPILTDRYLALSYRFYIGKLLKN